MEDYKRGSHTVWTANISGVDDEVSVFGSCRGCGQRCRELLREISRSQETFSPKTFRGAEESGFRKLKKPHTHSEANSTADLLAHFRQEPNTDTTR